MTDGKDIWNSRFAQVDQIFGHLPHRFPMLMIDRVESWEPGKSVTAVKNISFNEPYLQGHFPSRPVMPGVLMIEAIAQASAILGYLSMNLTPETHTFLLVGVDEAKFKRMVIPGDRMLIHSSLVRTIRSMIKIEGRIEVEGELVCSARLMTALVSEKDG